MVSKALIRTDTPRGRRGNVFIRYSHWVLLAPFLILFITFIILPILLAIGLSFTNFNGVESPNFVFLSNYIRIFTKDSVFMQKIFPNTILYAAIVGPGRYILSFVMAWLLAQLTKGPRTILAVTFYLPSMTAGVTISTVFRRSDGLSEQPAAAAGRYSDPHHLAAIAGNAYAGDDSGGPVVQL